MLLFRDQFLVDVLDHFINWDPNWGTTILLGPFFHQLQLQEAKLNPSSSWKTTPLLIDLEFLKQHKPNLVWLPTDLTGLHHHQI